MSSIRFDRQASKIRARVQRRYDRKQSGPGLPGKSWDRLDDVRAMELDSVSRTDDGLRRGRLKLISGRNEWQLASQRGMARRNLTGLALSTLPFTVRPSKPGQTLALQRVKHGRTGVTRT
jgi:hypothetical protein